MALAVATPDAVKKGDALLTELIQRLTGHEELSLLVEHLHSAHTYLLGSMPLEFSVSMRDARHVVGQVKDPEFRKSLNDAIDVLTASVHRTGTSNQHRPLTKPQRPSPALAQSRLWDFFNSTDVALGVFYPKKHIIATFPSYDQAVAACAALYSHGFSTKEAVAASGEEMLLFLAEFEHQHGLWGKVMARISQFFGTEEVFVTQDTKEALHGAGFLAIYCPSERECDRAREIIEPFGPVAMQRYLTGGIQSLI